MDHPDPKAAYYDLLSSVTEKWNVLPRESHLKAALSRDRILKLAEEIRADSPENLEFRRWPPTFLLIDRHSVQELLKFESDLNLVISHSRERRPAEILQFLQAEPNDDRTWSAGMFEVYVKATLLRKMSPETVTFDSELPNRRRPDIRIVLNGRTMYLECSVITDSDEDRGTWDRFLAAKKVDPTEVLIRPGKFSPAEPKSPSPYYDCLRFYAKVYDKLAKDLDPTKSQLSDEAPNILLVSFNYWAGHLSAKSHGVGWAQDELFVSQPRIGARLKEEHPGLIDISLLGWLDFMAEELVSKGRLDWQKYGQNLNQLLRASTRLGAILLFDDCSLKGGRRNYNASNASQLTHKNMAWLEMLLGVPPVWQPGNWISA